MLDARARGVRAGAGRRGHHRGQPGSRRPGALLADLRAGRLHPDLASACSRAVAARPARSSTARTRPARASRRRREARARRLRARQPRPDLRHAGGVRRRLRRLASTRPSAPASTTSRAYALIVEDGTPLAARVRRGELPAPDDDVAADRYGIADGGSSRGAGCRWYEVSNWARRRRARAGTTCGYWRGDDWWGIGPGAHSHVGGVRWWNVKHPRAYAERLAAGLSPAAGRRGPHRQTSGAWSASCSGCGWRRGCRWGTSTTRAGARGDRGSRRPAGRGGPGLRPAGADPAGRLLADAVIRRLVA